MRNFVVVAASFLGVIAPAFAADERPEEDSKSIFNIVEENDSFAGTDRDYTNGTRISWLSAEDNMPYWARTIANFLPLATDGNKRISLAAGQNMYTPSNITVSQPQQGDQPWAGWLYGSVGMVSDTGKTLDNVTLTLGVVGPASLAKETQEFVHHVISSPQPKGWGNQLSNEPGVILTYERKWRGLVEFSPYGLGMDVIPHLGGDLGNVSTDATAGATFRVGFDLPADYGPPRIRPSLPGSDFFIPTEKIGGYLFTTLAERVVGRNIFLDGNTFGDSAHVNKETFVNSLQVGAAATYGPTRLSYTEVYMSKEFTTQPHAEKFGALTLSCRF
jgi:lipid A 3-O-deacylase